ncbi:nucleotide exchange factor GrpE [Pseudogracilibacillus sp. SO30301A]|uniref:nucleotide exchange factor GrpE n=1 Tax=Pseudogracilibacillus sp. SO30301A TaxID=3098291 RepID=UPI00300E33C9
MNEQEKETVITEEDAEADIQENESKLEAEEDENSDQPQEEEETVSKTLQFENEKLTAEVEQLNDRLLRNQAEFENYKRRTQKEKTAERKYKSEELALELLPILDNFERALQTEVSEENKGFVEGMQMVYNQLVTALQSQGIEQIETVEKEFDPNYHHAVMQIEDEEFASNIIVEELQKGYMLKDKVIRPAMVKVNK